MKTDLVKAATILGLSAAFGIVAAAFVIVIGVRWAVESALAPQVRSLEATIIDASNTVGVSVDEAAGRVDTAVTASADQLGEQVVTSVGSIDTTLERAWSEPMLVAAPRPLPVAVPQPLEIGAPAPLPVEVSGLLSVQGPEAGGRSVPVDASILGGSSDGGSNGE